MNRYNFSLSDLPEEDFVKLRDELNPDASTVGAVSFNPEAPKTIPVVVFAGNGEKFYMLRMARDLTGPVLYFQDITSPWYLGSELLPDLSTLIREVIPAEIGNGPVIFFGQSSGGYAALVASRYFPNSLAIAFAPQTCSAARLARSGVIVDRRLPQKKAPEGIIDVQELYKSTPENGSRALIVVSRAEEVGVDYLWLDHLYAARMTDLPSVTTLISPTVGHSVAMHNGMLFSKLLQFMANGERTDPVSAMQEFLLHIK